MSFFAAFAAARSVVVVVVVVVVVEATAGDSKVSAFHQSPRAQRALNKRFLDLSRAQRARMGRRCLVRVRRKKARRSNKERAGVQSLPPKEEEEEEGRSRERGRWRFLIAIIQSLSLSLSSVSLNSLSLSLLFFSTHVITRSGLFRRPLHSCSSFGLHGS